MSILQPRLAYLNCPDAQRGHRMAWWQWGDEDAAHVVVCVHGLTRQRRDFAVLPRSPLSHPQAPCRPPAAVCPVTVGPRTSDWCPAPYAHQLPTFAAYL